MDALFKKILLKHRKSQKGRCMYRDAYGLRCKNRAIASHTVQKSVGLNAIAEHGHVSALSFDPFTDSPSVDFKNIGKSKASVFPGFCNRHDTDLFQEIEASKCLISARSLLLTSYRSICQELYKKEANLRLFSDLRGASSPEQSDHLDAHLYGTKLAIRDLTKATAEHENALHTGNMDGFEGWIFEFEETLPFCCASPFSPEFDAEGRRVLPGVDEEWHSIAWFTGRISNKNLLLIGGFTKNRNQDIDGFLRSLESIRDDDMAEFSLNLSVFYAENSFFRPSWVSELEPDTKSWITSTFRQTVPGVAESGAIKVFDFNQLLEIKAVSRTFFEA